MSDELVVFHNVKNAFNPPVREDGRFPKSLMEFNNLNTFNNVVLTPEIKKKLLDEFPFIPTAELVERYGISYCTIHKYAKKNGLKKDEEAIRRWKDDNPRSITKNVIEDYPYYTNAELAEKYGVTINRIRSIANNYRLHKDWDFLRKPSSERYASSIEQYKKIKEYENNEDRTADIDIQEAGNDTSEYKSLENCLMEYKKLYETFSRDSAALLESMTQAINDIKNQMLEVRKKLKKADLPQTGDNPDQDNQ